MVQTTMALSSISEDISLGTVFLSRIPQGKELQKLMSRLLGGQIVSHALQSEYVDQICCGGSLR
jgi:hypothetical protein